MKIGTLLLAFLLPILPVWAQVQEPLDLEKALQLGLDNNIKVKIGVENRNLR